jgi:WhiB family transcriptional regulator, redox-sensing transcriptional regulator
MKKDKLYLELQQAIEKSPIIPPCQITDPDLWFGNEDDAASTRFRDAKNMCSYCPAIQACAAYAIANDEMYGVWGGLTPRERQLLRMKHKSNNPKVFVKTY